MKAFGLALALVSPALAIWPAPTSYTNGSTTLWFSQNISVTYNGQPLELSSSSYSKRVLDSRSSSYNTTAQGWDQQVVEQGVQRTFSIITEENFIPWKFYPRNEDFEPSKESQQYITSLAITQTESGPGNSTAFESQDGQVDESYELDVGTNGTASLAAETAVGILRGLETFTQLFYTHTTGGIYTSLAPVAIKDAPKFGHRGLSLDVSRDWYPVENIIRTIDGLAYNKFNRLHIHMTDSQSWPMDIPALPELSEKGAYRKGLSYTPENITAILDYGYWRGVEVVIEFDMPGHMGAVSHAYPDLVTAYNAEPWGTYCAEPPCGQLKLNDSAVDDFIDTLFADVLPRISPYSSYFHTGGDELNANAYLLDNTVNSNDTAVIQPLLQKFLDNAHAKIRSAGLVPIVWEEMLVTWNVSLGDDVLIQSWGATPGSLDTITAAGHKAIAGDYNYWYLDCGRGQFLDFTPESYATYYPFNDWCGPVKNWKLIYSFDPVANLSEAQAALVVGGEVALWSEQTDPVNLDDLLWPRASAAGEVLWSGRQDAAGVNRTLLDASPRLAQFRERLVARGINSGPVQMIFCTQSDASECSL